MRTSERHHLKDNELAIAVRHASTWATENQRAITLGLLAIAVVAVGIVGYITWRNSVDGKARAMLGEAMVIQEARVVPPAPPSTDPTAPVPTPAPQPGTYQSEKAKLEAALPKFLAAADTYPSSDSGQTARYHAASALVGLGRFDEAIQQYDRVISDGSGLLPQMARLGKAEAQMRSSRHDAAIATFKEISERTDSKLPKEAVLLELARAYKAAGKNEDARKTLTQIVEQHAQSPFAAEAKTELEKIGAGG
jgi:tetratricopeptide (TPR) repeat protein